MPRPILAAFLALLPLCVTPGADAQVDSTADRIEEDWSVTIATPDPGVTCPQISTTIKVDPSESTCSAMFTLNYRDSPTFLAGGMQLKFQNGEQTLTSASRGTAQLQTAQESITWTQRLRLSEGNLQFKIMAASSTTWGNIASSDDFAVSIASSLSSLAGYSPATSVLDSGPSFGSNRVASMKLLRIRYYRGTTLLSTDETPRDVVLSN